MLPPTRRSIPAQHFHVSYKTQFVQRMDADCSIRKVQVFVNLRIQTNSGTWIIQNKITVKNCNLWSLLLHWDKNLYSVSIKYRINWSSLWNNELPLLELRLWTEKYHLCFKKNNNSNSIFYFENNLSNIYFSIRLSAKSWNLIPFQ